MPYMHVLQSRLHDKGDEIKKAYPKGRFNKLFWEEQFCAACTKIFAKFTGIL